MYTHGCGCSKDEGLNSRPVANLLKIIQLEEILVSTAKYVRNTTSGI